MENEKRRETEEIFRQKAVVFLFIHDLALLAFLPALLCCEATDTMTTRETDRETGRKKRRPREFRWRNGTK